MRAWALIVIGLAVAMVAVLGPPLVQMQKDLSAARTQKRRSSERVIANLKTELDAANQARTRLQGGLEEAKLEITKRQSEIERLTAELEKAIDLAKDANARNQQEDPVSGPSDPWQPQRGGRLRMKRLLLVFFTCSTASHNQTSSLGLVSALRVSKMKQPLTPRLFRIVGAKVRRSWHSDRQCAGE